MGGRPDLNLEWPLTHQMICRLPFSSLWTAGKDSRRSLRQFSGDFDRACGAFTACRTELGEKFPVDFVKSQKQSILKGPLAELRCH